MSQGKRWVLLTTMLLGVLSGCESDGVMPGGPRLLRAGVIRHGPARRFESEIRAFEARDVSFPPPIDGVVFVGSSSIRRWETLEQDFSGVPVIKRGFGGSQIADVNRYCHRIVLPYRPRVIVLYAGLNDISAGKSPGRVLADFQGFVARVHARMPGVPIAYVSINTSIARWDYRFRMREANRRIAEYIEGRPHLAYIETEPAFLGEDGLPVAKYFVEDQLHLSREGYRLWKSIIRPRVMALYQAAGQ